VKLPPQTPLRPTPIESGNQARSGSTNGDDRFAAMLISLPPAAPLPLGQPNDKSTPDLPPRSAGTAAAADRSAAADPAANADAGTAPVKPQITVLRQETHLATSRTPSQPRDEAKSAAAEDETATAGDAEPRASAASRPAAAKSKMSDEQQTGGHAAGRGIAALPGFGGTATTTCLPLATLQDIARPIEAEAARMAAPVRSTAQVTETDAAGGTVRILEFSLTPDNLDRIVVRMRLTASGLDIRLTAANPGTAHLLAQDSHTLLALIVHDDIPLRDLSVEVSGGAVFADTPPRGPARSAAPQPEPNDHPPQHGHDGRARDQDRRHENNPPASSGFAVDLV